MVAGISESCVLQNVWPEEFTRRFFPEVGVYKVCVCVDILEDRWLGEQIFLEIEN